MSLHSSLGNRATPSQKIIKLKEDKDISYINKNSVLGPGTVAHACRQEDCLPKSVRPASAMWLNIISTKKIQKLVQHGGMCLYSQLLCRLKKENHFNLGGRGCSEL